MNLLHANDRPGAYPASWYAATAEPLAPFAPLRGATRADVVVVGGGYTGLSAALHLARAGVNVALVEAQRVGFGASGRNGGQLGSGQRMEQDALERLVGDDAARVLWQMGEEAKALVKTLAAEIAERFATDCNVKPGVAWTGESAGDVSALHRYAEHLARRYGYDQIDALDREAFAALCPSPAYRGGILDRGAAHLHPLRLALGMAQLADEAGVRIFERSQVHDIERGSHYVVKTDRGRITASQVILGCNGYLGGLDRKVAARVMPINNFIAATEPLGDRAAEVLAQDVAVADSRFVVNYFRLSEDKRLLFGGGESYGYRFPRDIAKAVRKPMLEIFPHLKGTRIDYAWGGTLAITMRRMPYLAKLGPGMLSASGYSGHGVGTATHAGKLMAEALMGESAGFDALAAVPALRFPGGPALRSPLLVLAMTWYALRDRVGI